MALVNCPDCGVEVSEAARACPKCGRRRPGKPPGQSLAGRLYPANRAWGVFLLLISVAAIFSVWAWCENASTRKSVARWAEIDASWAELRLLYAERTAWHIKRGEHPVRQADGTLGWTTLWRAH